MRFASATTDIEREILGTMLADKECLINGMARLKKEYFTDNFYQAVFSLAKKMYEDGKHVDLITVSQEGKTIFKDRGVSWAVIKESFTCGSFAFLVDKLEKCYRNRRLMNLAKEISKCVGEGADPDEIVSAIETEIYSAVNEREIKIVTPREHAMRVIDTLAESMEKKSNGGIPTGYPDIDILLNGGMEPKELIIFAARTGKGKTAFAMNIMRNVAVKQKQPSLYINTEMTEKQMDLRWVAMLSQIRYFKLATGDLTEEEYRRATKCANMLDNGAFYSIDVPDLNMSKLISICRRYAVQKKCKVIVVDYIGRMDTMDPKMKEWEVLYNAAKRLKTIAQELNVTVIMLAQMNDYDQLEGAKKMKNECSLFGYLREADDEEIAQGINYALDITKNRSGPPARVLLRFIGETLTFQSVEFKREEEPADVGK